MGKMHELLEKDGRKIKHADLESEIQEIRSNSQTAGAPAGPISPRPPSDGVWRGEGERLVSLHSPNSPQAKRIDILRSQLLYPFHGDPPRIIMVASSAPREGRSLLTANLAVSFARGLQQYVLCLDCHLAAPKLHQMFGVPRQPGLGDFLEYGTTVPEIIHWTAVDKLSLIPAGSPTGRSSEILATDKMAALIMELRSRYHDRYIILDTPPVQAFDDPAVLARMVEGIVFVVLSGRTDRDVVLRSLHNLPEEKIIGLVLNDRLDAVQDAHSVVSGGEGSLR